MILKALLVACVVVFLLCVAFLWRDSGCKGWKLLHGEIEHEYYRDAHHTSPQYDEETGEAYAKEFEVYKLRCQRCGEWMLWGDEYEEKEERRWEPDTVQEMMNDD